MKLKLILVVFTTLLVGYSSLDKQFYETEESNLIVLVKYKAQPEKGDQAVSELIKLIENVKQEPHFVNIKLHVDPNDDTNVLLYEEWNNESYYKGDHMNTDHLQKFIANSREFLAGPPEITFWKVEEDFK